MIEFIKIIFKNSLFKVSSLSTVSNLIKILSSLFSFKISTYYLGPSGIAIVENVRNFLTIIENSGTLGFQSGIVKYVAQNENEILKRNKILATAFLTLLGTSLLITIFIIFNTIYNFFDFFSGYKLPQSIFLFIGLSVPFLVLNVFFLTVLNALGKYKTIIYCNIIAYALNLLLIYLLIYLFQLNGAILALVIIPIFLATITFYYFSKEINFKVLFNIKLFEFKYFKLLANFSIMTLFSGILSPFVFLEIRNLIEENINLNSAGLWSALFRFSGFYMMFIVSICTLYFYPKLSKSVSKKEHENLIKQYIYQLMPFFLIGFGLVYLLRNLLIEFVLSFEFNAISTMFKWQILGDICKSIALIFGYYLLANKKISLFIFLECLSLGSFYLLSKLFIHNGIDSILISYFYSNLIYLTAILIVYFKIKDELQNNIIT